MAHDQPQLKILGAAYGPCDVTDIIVRFVKNNTLTVRADDTNFPDSSSWNHGTKTLVVVYQFGGESPQTAVTQENYTMNIPYVPKLKILGAAFGPHDVTAKVKDLISDNALTVVASNNIFPNTFPNHIKSLVVVYQYSDESPQTAITEQHSTMNIYYVPTVKYQPSCNSLIILGAAYGRAEVTSKVQLLVRNNSLDFKANNEIFYDSFNGTTKTFMAVYQYGRQSPEIVTAVEDQEVYVASSAAN